jgi:hypothetical protein
MHSAIIIPDDESGTLQHRRNMSNRRTANHCNIDTGAAVANQIDKGAAVPALCTGAANHPAAQLTVPDFSNDLGKTVERPHLDVSIEIRTGKNHAIRLVPQ